VDQKVGPPGGSGWDATLDEAVALLRGLIRIDTTNPPGNELAAAEYLAEILSAEGIEPTVLAPAPGRASVIARLAGRGERGPLLLQGHTDVVPADPSEWRHPPFSAAIADGCIWGRGALDMKGTVVMQLMAVLLARRAGLRPRGDIIFAAVADEEAGGSQGAAWLVDQHADLVRAEVALGETGAYSLHIGDAAYYPIQICEKQTFALSLKTTGPSGHGSQPIRDGAMAAAGRVLERLSTRRLPMHLTPAGEQFIRGLAEEQPELLGLLDPGRCGAVLAELGLDGRMFEGLLHNTAVPTVISGGSKSNVIPGSVEIQVDGRMLPGQRGEDFIEEVRALCAGDALVEPRISPIPPAPAYQSPQGPFFDHLCRVVRELDPEARPLPCLATFATDARHFSRLGTDCYGFAPMRLPRNMPFWALFHGANERIPIDGLAFGMRALYRVIEDY
jgi:acetylornithine deacetylase/succinyl-diaminopimelate desuccinylase-like protein